MSTLTIVENKLNKKKKNEPKYSKNPYLAKTKETP